jgi:hypothetical protein
MASNAASASASVIATGVALVLAEAQATGDSSALDAMKSYREDVRKLASKVLRAECLTSS